VVPIGWVKRDLQIIISDSNNKPPIIASMKDTCIIAGNTVSYFITATDPNPNQIVTLTCFGGPFVVASGPATFTPNTPGISFSSGVFNWNTNCTHIYPNYYTVMVQAKDNFSPIPAINIKSFRIKVVGPPVQNVTATPQGNTIKVAWENPYVCSTVSKFLGFSIWRREGPNPFAIDTCLPGLAGKGYVKVASNLLTYEYIDNNVIIGKNYCYRVLAEFGDVTSLGYITNFTESLPSNEACTQLKKDIPVMTRASVLVTDESNGSIEVHWSKPSKSELDTIQNPAPYKYELYRSSGFNVNNPQLLQTFTSATFYGLSDSSYTDNSINTVNSAYNYYVRFYSNNNALGDARYASSVFLKIDAAGNALKLSWQYDVPWTNIEYHIYRKNPSTGLFDSIATTTANTYTDAPLINDSTYCYKIKSVGAYSITNVITPIINFSQEVCAVPIDTIGPCAPKLKVYNKCNTNNYAFDDFTNYLVWTKPDMECGGDAVKYYIYYAAHQGEDLVRVDSILNINDTVYLHLLNNTVAGCYAVAAVDSFNNIGDFSTVVCLDNCPLYELPNTFTPNNDGNNDFFVPIKPYRYIQKVNMKIYTSWGTLVFETNNPEIGWDGMHQQSGKQMPDGTYYYVCEVFEERLEIQNKPSKTLNGFIHLYR
jgi:gliding motility-associated-like protein